MIFKRIFLFFISFMFLITTCHSYSKIAIVKDLYQDNTVLIKKTKARITALKKQRQKLKTLKKWSESKEKSFVIQTEKLQKGLLKLGYKDTVILSFEEQINALQKQLKFLNNNKANLNANKKWTPKKEEIYLKKAGILIDSIIRMRSGKRK